MTEEEKNLHIADIRAYMTMESLPFDQEDATEIKAILDGKLTTEESIKCIIEKYKE